MVKEKLTLSVDREVVKRAKSLGINISHITEKVLKGYTSAESPNGSLHEAYRQLCDSILPLLKEFDCNVRIAEGVDEGIAEDEEGNVYNIERPFTVLLESDGSFYIDEFDDRFEDIKKIDQRDFFEPKMILTNLVDALARSKEARKEKMREILMAKRIVDAMSKTLVKRAPKKYRRVLPEERNEKAKEKRVRKE